MGKPSLLPLKLVGQHVRSCRSKSGRCGLCHWHKNRPGWVQGLCDPKWAKVTVQGGKFARIGCTYCCLAETGGPWAEFSQKPLTLRKFQFNRHEASAVHKKAAEAFQCSERIVFAPAASEFNDALKKMVKGGSCRDGGCMSDKRTQMRWCLSEATLSLSRDRLQSAEAMSVMRDERKGRLLLRYRATLPDLSIHSGVFGFIPTQGFADSIGEATRKSITDFCTPKLNPPRQVKQTTCPVDQKLLRNVQEKTQILVTDAAGPELLASRILSGKRQAASAGFQDPFFKRVRVIGRDAAHASTRLLKRPFEAHPEIEKLLNEFVTGKDSFAQKVQYSPLYQQWWKKSLVDEAGGSDLSAAKHRFASYMNPLAKISKNMGAMMQVCHQIATVRSDDSSGSAWAHRLIENFSGKKAVALGLLADAACTCHDLTRWLDSEDVDICQVNSQVQCFVASLRTLFGAKKVLELPTYTKHIVEELTRRPITILHGSPRQVRISQTDIAEGMKILQEPYQRL